MNQARYTLYRTLRTIHEHFPSHLLFSILIWHHLHIIDSIHGSRFPTSAILRFESEMFKISKSCGRKRSFIDFHGRMSISLYVIRTILIMIRRIWIRMMAYIHSYVYSKYIVRHAMELESNRRRWKIIKLTVRSTIVIMIIVIYKLLSA